MVRHIGLWKNSFDNKSDIGELIVTGNEIEFYYRGNSNIFNSYFDGFVDNHHYRVVGESRFISGNNKSLSDSTAFKVAYVLQQNCTFDFNVDNNIIGECSFIIPELIEWLEMSGVDFGMMEDEAFYAYEKNTPTVLLYENSPKIEIDFESESYKIFTDVDTRTTAVVKKQPRIVVSYMTPTNINCVIEDIRQIMQFWGLLIGVVAEIEDVRLKIEGQDLFTWAYFNKDFSYNLRSTVSFFRPRTTKTLIRKDISAYFAKWYEFCTNEKYSLIRNMYFAANNKTPMFLEDIFIQYVKILEGYHLRLTGDEETANKLKEAFKPVEKEVKKLIFDEAGKPLFSAVLDTVLPNWKFNSDHAKDIAHWIAVGYLGKTSLKERIKELDNKYFKLIYSNAKKVYALDRAIEKFESDTIEQYSDLYYDRIVATRNYYAHYKNDRQNVLDVNLMRYTIDVLKALLIMIFYSHMGMEEKEIRSIMISDMELKHVTNILSNDGEFCGIWQS